jgi:hypothetical protein
MATIWTIALLLFLAITFLVWKFIDGYYKKVYSTKARNTWGARTYFWHFIIMISGATTALIIYLLKLGNILTF